MPAPTSGLRTHTACSQGVVKVVEDTWLLTGHVPREAGVVQVADETLEPGHSARGGQRLAGEVACGNARCYGPCQGPHRDPTQPCIGCWVCALWRLLTGAPVHRVTPLPPPLGKHLDPGGGLHSCCSNGGWEERTATRIKKRKRGHNSSTRSWIWGRQNKQGSAERRGALGLCPTCPRRPRYRLSLAIQEILPKQQHQLCPEGHGGNRQETGPRGQTEDVLCSCGQLAVPLGTSFLYSIVQNFWTSA